MAITRAKIHQSFYFFSLLGLAIAIPISNFLMSLFTILLIVNWVLEGGFKKKFGNRKQNLIILCFAIPFLIHIVWLVGTQNLDYGLDDLRKKLPMLLIPIVIATSDRLDLKKYQAILSCYVLTVLIASFMAFISFLFKENIDYRNMVWFISHIRFALNVCLAVAIITLEIIRTAQAKDHNYRAKVVGYLLVIFWFFFFLLMLRSYTAFGILLLLSILFIHYCFSNKNIRKNVKWTVGTIYFSIIILIVGYETYLIVDYQTPKGGSKEPLKQYTAKGSPYTHAKNGFIENGHFIYDYISEGELREAWAAKGYRSLDEDTDNGNNMYETLIRYLNSKGYTKDAEGVEKLLEKDVKNITYGYANYLAVKKFSLRYPTYQLLFEINLYRNSGYYLHSSLFQRLHLWKNSFQIIKRQPLFGVGTGDVSDAISQQLQSNNSQLKETRLRTHNQYLTFILAFGFIGFLIICYAYFYIIKKTRVKNHYLFLSFLIIILYSMISEDTLETQAGVTLFSFFFAFLTQMIEYDKIDIPKFRLKKGEDKNS